MHTGAPRRRQTLQAAPCPPAPELQAPTGKCFPSSQACCSVDSEYFDISPQSLYMFLKVHYVPRQLFLSPLTGKDRGPRGPSSHRPVSHPLCGGCTCSTSVVLAWNILKAS